MEGTELTLRIIEITVQATIGIVGIVAYKSWKKQINYKKQIDAITAMLKFLNIYEHSIRELKSIKQTYLLSNYQTAVSQFMSDFLKTKKNSNNNDNIPITIKIDNSNNAFDDLIRSTYDVKIYWHEEINNSIPKIMKHYQNLKEILLEEEQENNSSNYMTSCVENLILNRFNYKPSGADIEIILSEISKLNTIFSKKIKKEKDWVDILFFRFNPLYK